MTSLYDNPWWGLDGSDGAPEKQTLFTQPNKHGYSSTWAMEDFFQHNNVFMNSRGQRCHSDSYGTLVDFSALDKCLKLLEDQYHPTPDDWRGLVKDWTEGGNHQPPLRLVGGIIKSKTETKKDEKQKQQEGK